jgi:hypothetical protein
MQPKRTTMKSTAVALILAVRFFADQKLSARQPREHVGERGTLGSSIPHDIRAIADYASREPPELGSKSRPANGGSTVPTSCEKHRG